MPIRLSGWLPAELDPGWTHSLPTLESSWGPTGLQLMSTPVPHADPSPQPGGVTLATKGRDDYVTDPWDVGPALLWGSMLCHEGGGVVERDCDARPDAVQEATLSLGSACQSATSRPWPIKYCRGGRATSKPGKDECDPYPIGCDPQISEYPTDRSARARSERAGSGPRTAKLAHVGKHYNTWRDHTSHAADFGKLWRCPNMLPNFQRPVCDIERWSAYRVSHAGNQATTLHGILETPSADAKPWERLDISPGSLAIDDQLNGESGDEL
ncbi:hypothetical protein GGX14DRAFT_657952 [Mycena pura]|uniref:Uncharacterized protein n=1 Tax=Mycena pura TaxID=153505 RepID=A0AAD7E186_9AGAR|nr:hypothetical protein GGX14DRAFT_657952 [Mycena pura]